MAACEPSGGGPQWRAWTIVIGATYAASFALWLCVGVVVALAAGHNRLRMGDGPQFNMRDAVRRAMGNDGVVIRTALTLGRPALTDAERALAPQECARRVIWLLFDTRELHMGAANQDGFSTTALVARGAFATATDADLSALLLEWDAAVARGSIGDAHVWADAMFIRMAGADVAVGHDAPRWRPDPGRLALLFSRGVLDPNAPAVRAGRGGRRDSVERLVPALVDALVGASTADDVVADLVRVVLDHGARVDVGCAPDSATVISVSNQTALGAVLAWLCGAEVGRRTRASRVDFAAVRPLLFALMGAVGGDTPAFAAELDAFVRASPPAPRNPLSAPGHMRALRFVPQHLLPRDLYYEAGEFLGLARRRRRRARE